MCGIFALLNHKENNIPDDFVSKQFAEGTHRGPDVSQLELNLYKFSLGFHRLIINGLNAKANQPFFMYNIYLVCNGEIYNHKKLFEMMGIIPETNSDCEVIIHLYRQYGIEQTLAMLDGEYSFVLCDFRIREGIPIEHEHEPVHMYIARDPFGVRPLYQFKNIKNHLYGFASELKVLHGFYKYYKTEKYKKTECTISQFKPGTYSIYTLTCLTQSKWELEREAITYFTPNFTYSLQFKIDFYYQTIAVLLENAVAKRCANTERGPVACLLSGGLDSSLVAALACISLKKNMILSSINGTQQHILETFSIGLEGSPDLQYARIVANYLQTRHTEVILTENEITSAITEVIRAIESYDITTIRASLGNYLIGKYISKYSKAKVVLNGDGSDELFGGYIYMSACPNVIEYDREIKRLLTDIHMYDVLRSDKSISAHGLEARTPFLDRTFVQFVLSISPTIRMNALGKDLLRRAFSREHYITPSGQPLLPDEILWRPKEAFSDGVCSKNRSLFQIIQEHCAQQMKIETAQEWPINVETERAYYYHLFQQYYPGCSRIIPYMWMPKYINSKSNDPSARTLSIYKS